MKNRIYHTLKEYILNDQIQNFKNLPAIAKKQIIVDVINDPFMMDPDDYYALCQKLPVLIKQYNDQKISANDVVDLFLNHALKHFNHYLETLFHEIMINLEPDFQLIYPHQGT